MPKHSALRLLSLIIGLAWSVGAYNYSTVISVADHDMSLELGQQQNATFQILNANWSEPRRIFLQLEDDMKSVADLDPRSIQLDLKPDEPRTEFQVLVRAIRAGKSTVCSNTSDVATNIRQAFLRITVNYSDRLTVVCEVVGWLYFIAWSVSYYPQIFDNWRRKSVVGLNFDFLFLNIIGFILYSLFNAFLFWDKPVQAQYFDRHPTGVNPVLLNDVLFSVHAVFACMVTIIQCFVYERTGQVVSRLCWAIVAIIVSMLTVLLILSVMSVIMWLDFLYACSYTKLFITLVKYVPQAYMNYKRKSTVGWSIGNVLLDFTGGVLSILQMLVQAYNNDDWGNIFGDPTKFGLGFFSILFDVFFMLQHYLFYRGNPGHELLDDTTDSAEEESVDQADSGSQSYGAVSPAEA